MSGAFGSIWTLLVPLLLVLGGRPGVSFEGDVSDCVSGRSTPVGYANILVEGPKAGSMSDESGRFRVAYVPAGRWVVLIQSIGRGVVRDTVDFPDRGTVVRHYCFTTGPYVSFLHLRDSLVARGRWHPTIDSTLAASMRQAERVRVLRIDWRLWSSRSFAGPMPVLAEAPAPSDSALHELVEALEDSSLYIPVLQGDRHMCIYEPGVVIRFEGTARSMEMFLCFGCGEFRIHSSDGIHQIGYMGSRAGPFIRVALEAFPTDPELHQARIRDR